MLSLPGGVSGIGDVWAALGRRAARPTDETDPWAVLGTPTMPTPGGMTGAGTAGLGAEPLGGLPMGVSLTGHGGVDIAGLEWLGARAYDAGTRGFLSMDPLAPVLGAGWDGNPYAYAGNNPLNTTDPTGLRPLTDDELKAYDGSAGGAIAAAKDWVGDNWLVGKWGSRPAGADWRGHRPLSRRPTESSDVIRLRNVVEFRSNV